MKAYLQTFTRYRHLLMDLVARDLKVKYRRSALGFLWSILNPILMALVISVVFSQMFRFKQEYFASYYLTGALIFNFMSEATSNSLTSVISGASLIKKVYIPKYIFPLEKVCFALVNCVFSFVALIIVMIFTGAPLHPTVVLAVYPLLTLFLFSLGVGLVLATLTVFFRDIMHLWSVFTTMLMYFSAIFYDPSQMGSLVVYGFSINMSRFIKFNPLYWYITAFRTAVLDGEMLSWSMLWICGACALVTLVFGLLVFRKQQDKFVLHI